MANEQPKWKSINMGEILPCQSFLRKKDGEILKLSTVGGVKVGQDCYYLPVDEVISVIKDYPVEKSEDERIINNIRKVIGWYRDIFTEKSLMPEEYQEIDAWLEKQGEQKLNVNDNAKEMFIKALERVEEQNAKGYKLTDCDKNSWWEDFKAYTTSEQILANSCKTCKDEKKPTDKVEPKFKVGDWVVYCNDDVDLITGIEENGYCINNGGYIPFVCESDIRLWTIEDAKDGDVLVASDGSIFIFKGTIDCACKHYVALTTDDVVKFNEGLEHYWETSTAVHPATKKQRDLLFQKLKEAGYEWNAEKKELTKIEQNPLIEMKTPEESLGVGSDTYNKIVDECVYGEQKPAWSEEDEEIHRKCICAMRASACGFPEEEKFVEQVDNWLKSLKDRYSWKPSDAQMNALNYVVNLMASSERPTENDLYYNILKSLRQQLMKLKDEK